MLAEAACYRSLEGQGVRFTSQEDCFLFGLFALLLLVGLSFVSSWPLAFPDTPAEDTPAPLLGEKT